MAIAWEVEAVLPVVDYSQAGLLPFSVLLMVTLLVIGQPVELSGGVPGARSSDVSAFSRSDVIQSEPVLQDLLGVQQTLINAGVAAVITQAVQRQLAAAGCIVRNGQLIDASIVRAPMQHFTSADKELVDRGEVPPDCSAAKRAQKDLDARWTKKHGKSYHDYRPHVSDDMRHSQPCP